MGYKLKVDALKLPEVLPAPLALKNSGQNSAAYEPWFWEMEYHIYRYLEWPPIEDLQARHTDLVRNLTRLAMPDRAYIPIQAFQSAWYWYRKEHQTRLELFMRGVEPMTVPPTSIPVRSASPFPENPLGDPRLLFRYAQKAHAEAARDQGIFRIAPAASYKSIEGDAARMDEEMIKSVLLPGGHTTVKDMAGNVIKVIGDVRIDHSGPEYFVSCFSSIWDVRLFNDFPGTTHCIVVRDVDAFASRLEAAGRRHFKSWYFHHNPAWYFDPHESSLNSHVSHATHKDFKFAYQAEYRFLWANHGGEPVQEPQFLELGPLADIIDVVEKPQEQ